MEHDMTLQSPGEPFRFQTSRQKNLYIKLRRILGPGPATFYREACSLMVQPQQFESTTHLVAHLLREIESAVRHVLLPYDFKASGARPIGDNYPESYIRQIEAIIRVLNLDKNIRKKWKEIATWTDTCPICDNHPKTHIEQIEAVIRVLCLDENTQEKWKEIATQSMEACPICDNRPSTHVEQIEAIVQDLGLDESIQERWKRVAIQNNSSSGLAAMAHREDLSLPRRVDSSFQAIVGTFESIFDSVLTAFEKQSTHIFVFLDELVHKEHPSKKDLSQLKNNIPHNDAVHNYFFKHLQSPGWLEPLHQAGFFNPPQSKEWNEELGRFTFAFWPPAQYLLRMAAIESVQQTILAIMHENVETDNPFIQSTILQIAQILPASLSATLVPALQNWIQDALVQILDFTRISDLVGYFAQGGECDAALALLKSCLTLFAQRETFTERSDYERMLSANMPLLMKYSAMKALSMISQLLEVEVYENYIRHRNVQEGQEQHLRSRAQAASTKSWLRKIGNTSNKSFPVFPSLLTLLVINLTQATEKAVQEQLLSIDTITLLLEEHPGRIFRRATLYLLSRFPQNNLDLVKRYLMDRALFDDRDVRYEYGLLAQTGFSALADGEKEQWLAWIEAGPDVQSYQEWYEKNSHAQPSDELVQQYVRVWQRDWLAEIESDLKGIWQERYDALVADLGHAEPEDDFPRFTWGRSVNEPWIEELRSMSVEQIFACLQEYQPSGDFMSPSREDVGRVLTTLISEEPSRFADKIGLFQDSDPVYVSAVLQGFTEAIRNHRSFHWECLLDLCLWVTSQRYTLTEGNVTIIGDPAWAWTCQMLAQLLLSATEAQPPVLLLSHSSKIWDILKPLTDDLDPAQEGEDAEEDQDSAMEYATRAINSIRGLALHAVISFALWHKRSILEESEGDSLNFEILPEIQAVLARHLNPNIDTSLAVRSVYGQRLANLVALDPQWVTEHLLYLFPSAVHQQALRIVTWNTYITFCNPYNNVFNLLTEEYMAAVERLGIVKQSELVIEDPDYRLGAHLIQFYWWGLLPLSSPESLLRRFFMKASDALRGEIFAFIGQAFYQTGEATHPEIVERCQRLWEWRISEAQSSVQITTYEHELASFGEWFRTTLCPPEWGLQQLEIVLALVGDVELSYAVVGRLAELAELYPTSVVRCLEFLVKGNTRMWTTSTWEKAVRPILVYALQVKADDTRQRARSMISQLALLGMTNFLDLLKGEA